MILLNGSGNRASEPRLVLVCALELSIDLQDKISEEWRLRAHLNGQLASILATHEVVGTIAVQDLLVVAYLKDEVVDDASCELCSLIRDEAERDEVRICARQ